MRYRHKPTKIEAFRWTGGPDQTEDPLWAVEAIRDGRISFYAAGSADVQILVDTPEGVMSGKSGVWVAQGVEGELYIIQPELFEQLYEFDADGVIDTWAGHWIVSILAPNGLGCEHMLDRQTMEQVIEPGQSVANTARILFNKLWPRRHEDREGMDREYV